MVLVYPDSISSRRVEIVDGVALSNRGSSLVLLDDGACERGVTAPVGRRPALAVRNNASGSDTHVINTAPRSLWAARVLGLGGAELSDDIFCELD